MPTPIQLLVASVVALCNGHHTTSVLAADKAEKLDSGIVLDMLKAESDREKAEVKKRSLELMPFLEDILDDPKCDYRHICRVFGTLCYLDADVTQFLDRAVTRLGDDERMVKISALKFIRTIGSQADAAPVVILLYDRHGEVRCAAAKTLVAIGGKRELAALDLVLKEPERVFRNGHAVVNNQNMEFYQKCRDELEARLLLENKEKSEKKDKPADPKAKPPADPKK